jgi:DNA-binding transcriptional regulator YiaG
MVLSTKTGAGLDEIRSRLAARRELPPPAERRALRVNAGISLRELGRALGVTAAAVHFWETGARMPRPAHLQAYLEALRLLAEECALEKAVA